MIQEGNNMFLQGFFHKNDQMCKKSILLLEGPVMPINLIKKQGFSNFNKLLRTYVTLMIYVQRSISFAAFQLTAFAQV